MNRNGIDLHVLHEMVEGISQHPEAGTVTVRTRSRWDDGFAVDGRSETFEGAGQVVSRTSPVYDSLANPVPLRLRVRRLP